MLTAGRNSCLFEKFWDVFRFNQDSFNLLYRPKEIFMARQALDGRSIFSKCFQPFLVCAAARTIRTKIIIKSLPTNCTAYRGAERLTTKLHQVATKVICWCGTIEREVHSGRYLATLFDNFES